MAASSAENEPSATLGFLDSIGDERVEVVCLGCKRCPSVSITELVGRVGDQATLEEIGRRARCGVCGHLGARLNPIPDYQRGITMGLGGPDRP